MNAQVMYELLEYLKKEKKDYEDKSLHLLKFIYDDIYNGLSEEIKKMDDDDCGYNYIQLVESFKAEIADYIDDDSSSILYYFKEMISDGKEEYIKAFFEKMDTYFKMIDNHLYRSDDFIPSTVIFNIYAMLRSYHLYKEDFNQFSKNLDSYSVLIGPGAFNKEYYNSGEDFCLSFKKKIFDKITSIKDFEEIPILKDKFDICFKNICNTDLDGEDLDALYDNLDFIIKVISDMRRLEEKDPDFDTKTGFEFIDNLFEYYLDDEFYFYAPILLYGNRFDYIRDSYSEYIDHNEYMDEIMDVICEFNNDLFKYLDSVNSDGKDSFITCMELVFDSDTLQEVWNKVNVLKDASNLFKLSPVPYQNVLEKVKELSSDKHKKQVKGQKVMYVSDTANKMDRPTSILDRMVEVYSTMYDVSEDYVSDNIVDSYCDDESIAVFEENVDNSLVDLFFDQEEARQKALEEAKMKEELSKENVVMDDMHMGDTQITVNISNEPSSIDNSPSNDDSSKGIQKSIKRFFSRK